MPVNRLMHGGTQVCGRGVGQGVDGFGGHHTSLTPQNRIRRNGWDRIGTALGGGINEVIWNSECGWRAEPRKCVLGRRLVERLTVYGWQKP
jgi:hypothetical protein